VKKVVLVADDEPYVRRLVGVMLGKDYTVLEAENGKKAVSMARDQKPDIILMDIMMPKMDGLTACYTLKTEECTRTIPVVMLTALSYELNKKMSEDIMGAAGYITKPFRLKDLTAAIERVLSPRTDVAAMEQLHAPSVSENGEES